MRPDFGVLTYLMHLVPVITHHFDPELSAFVSKCKVRMYQLRYTAVAACAVVVTPCA